MNVLDILFPPLCYSCNSYLKKEEKALNVCGACVGKIQTWNGLFCPICKKRIPLSWSLSSSWSWSPACHPDAPFTLAACSDYTNPAVKELLHTFKYKKIENAIHPITELLIKPYIQHLNNWSNVNGQMSNVVIVPIPLHPSKKRSRGFNQSALLAHALLQSLDVKHPEIVRPPYIETNILRRVRQTDPQAETKTAAERKENVKGCFAVNPKSYILNSTSSVILVDDVYTSGATMQEAVRVLKDVGAKRIIAFVIAKA